MGISARFQSRPFEFNGDCSKVRVPIIQWGFQSRFQSGPGAAGAAEATESEALLLELDAEMAAVARQLREAKELRDQMAGQKAALQVRFCRHRFSPTGELGHRRVG
jgi:hypothetical protein